MKFLKDVFINILSQGLFLAVQQIILFPVFESQLGQYEFGWFLLIYGIFNVMVVTISTSFTNLYQKKFNEYVEEYNQRTAYYTYYKRLIFYVFIMSIFSVNLIFFTHLKFIEFILIIILVLSTASRMFLMVWYRVLRQFNMILIVNVLLSVLYAMLFFIDFHNVVSILIGFIIIEILINTLVYIITQINIKNLMKARIRTFEWLSLNLIIISGFSGALMNYSDRFIIDFLLDASSITIFYIATLPTKLMLFPFNMISSVILSYIADTEKLTKIIKRKIIMILPIMFIIVSGISYLIGKILIYLLYPEYLDRITNIYYIVTITFGFICIDYVIRSFLLKYYSLKRKAIIDVMTLIIFVILSISFVELYEGLLAIAIAQLVTFVMKAVVEIVIFVKLDTASKQVNNREVDDI